MVAYRILVTAPVPFGYIRFQNWVVQFYLVGVGPKGFWDRAWQKCFSEPGDHRPTYFFDQPQMSSSFLRLFTADLVPNKLETQCILHGFYRAAHRACTIIIKDNFAVILRWERQAPVGWKNEICRSSLIQLIVDCWITFSGIDTCLKCSRSVGKYWYKGQKLIICPARAEVSAQDNSLMFDRSEQLREGVS